MRKITLTYWGLVIYLTYKFLITNSNDQYITIFQVIGFF